MPTDPQLLKQLQDLTAEVRKLRESMAATAGEAEGGGAPGGGAPEQEPIEVTRERVKASQDMTNEYEKVVPLAAQDLTFAKQKVAQQKDSAAIVEQEIEGLKTKSDLNEKDVKTAKEKVSFLKKGNEEAKKGLTLREQLARVHEKQVKSLKNQLDYWEDIGTAIASLLPTFDSVKKALSISGIIQLASDLYDAENAFMKTTGASVDFARSVTATYDATRVYGVSIREARRANEALYKSFTDFTMTNKDQREALAETGAVLQQLGVGQQTYATIIQNTTKMMGQSAGQAEATSRELVAFAKDIGVAPAQLTEQFSQMGASMARFGAQGVRAFKDLARISKITGLEMSKVLKLTDQFDTFDDAAKLTGKLNAALGGNFVNAMDMMMETDPAERFGMIRDSILDAGLSFDDMSYYQKKFYTESLGLSDVGDLAMMLSGNMDSLDDSMNKNSASLIEMKKNAQAVQSLQKQWNALLAAATPIILPLIDALRSMMTALLPIGEWMKENPEPMKLIVGGLLLMKLAMMGVSAAAVVTTSSFWILIPAILAFGYLMFTQAWASTFIEGLEKFAWVLVGLGVALVALAGIVKFAALDLLVFATVMKALAIASIAGGAAFYLVALSIDSIAYSLERANKVGADINKTLIILGTTIAALAITFTVLAIKSAIVAPVLWALGGAMLAMGAGTLMAAHAFEMFIGHTKTLIILSLTIAALAITFAVVAVKAAITAPILWALAAAFVAIGAGALLSAKAFGLFVDHYERADPETLKVLGESLILLGFGMVTAGVAGKAGAIGIGVFGAAVLAMGIGFKLAFDSIAAAREGMASLFTALGTINTDQLDIVAVKLQKIAEVLDSVNEKKVTAWATVIQRIQVESAVVRTGAAATIPGTSPAASQPTGGGTQAPLVIPVSLELAGTTLETYVIEVVGKEVRARKNGEGRI